MVKKFPEFPKPSCSLKYPHLSSVPEILSDQIQVFKASHEWKHQQSSYFVLCHVLCCILSAYTAYLGGTYGAPKTIFLIYMEHFLLLKLHNKVSKIGQKNKPQISCQYHILSSIKIFCKTENDLVLTEKQLISTY